MRKRTLPAGVMKACAGIVECANAPVYTRAIQKAAAQVGKSYGHTAVKEKEALATAIKLNLINQKEWPYERLRMVYDLPIHENTFSREKLQFCKALALELKLINATKSKGDL